MNARYYLPSIGKFASADTLVPDPQNPQSFNRYSYVLNNPLRYTDPTGHSCANPSGVTSGSGTVPEVVSCQIKTQAILKSTVRIWSHILVREDSHFYQYKDPAISHGTILSNDTILTHNHYGTNHNLPETVSFAELDEQIILEPVTGSVRGGRSAQYSTKITKSNTSAPETLLFHLDGAGSLGIQSGIHAGYFNASNAMASKDWSWLVGQEIGQVVYHNYGNGKLRTSVQWKTVETVIELNNQWYALVLQSGQQGQSGGGVFWGNGVYINHVGNNYGNYAGYNYIALNPLDVSIYK